MRQVIPRNLGCSKRFSEEAARDRQKAVDDSGRLPEIGGLPTMSDLLRHECGVAMVRLRKPLSYYQEKYGTPLWGFFKLFLLMEKQHNRGQDGAGVACVKLGMAPGEPYMFRERQIKSNPLDKIFKELLQKYEELLEKGTVHPEFAETVKKNFDFGAELYLGHLRYGTSGGYSLSACHPFFRRSPWPTRNLMLAGNFNMTNTRELNASLIAMGQHPIFATDTQAVLEKIGFFLDEEHGQLFRSFRAQGISGDAMARGISDKLDLARVIANAAKDLDGGYVLAGLVGNGDGFVVRDPAGIRPCWWFENDEVVAFASERAPLMTVFDADVAAVHEVEPGHVVVVKHGGEVASAAFTEPRPRAQCSFERIYFSRGNDLEIYRERKALGAHLAPSVLKAIGNDLENSVVGFIPNTAEVAYYGLMEALRLSRRNEVKKAILGAARKGELSDSLIDDLILRNWPRAEKVVSKDIKIRTFIGQEKWRNELASHVYDIFYGSVKPTDSLVVIDDSIVRGTTLRRSIIRILSRLRPKKIVIVSTAPQIRYPDCYGIDMSELGKFVAFEAAVALLKEHGRADLLEEVYGLCRQELEKAEPDRVNHVRKLYEPFTAEQISAKIVERVYPKNLDWSGPVEILFQSIESLHAALPNHTGDWYFTGHYPTPGGYRVVHQAYVNYFEQNEGRSY